MGMKLVEQVEIQLLSENSSNPLNPDVLQL